MRSIAVIAVRLLFGIATGVLQRAETGATGCGAFYRREPRPAGRGEPVPRRIVLPVSAE